jgi:mono/diheme cytochrome c family protein
MIRLLPGSMIVSTIVFAALVARADSAEPFDYVKDVRPILAKHCYECHGPDAQKSGLRLDTVAAAKEGGYNGPAVVAGSSGESLIVAAVTGAGDIEKMPPERPPLSEAEIAVLRAWIDQGAAAPADDAPAASKNPAAAHWSFQPLSNRAVPGVANSAWLRNPIDAFILKRLEAEGLAPSPEADRATLIRRASLDLLGLPPSPDEVEQFIGDGRPDAYERLVDRLLDSPRYGERWGRHWLDQARYADSNGYTIDGGRSIWKYRDWVINALNRNLPFDQFTVEQMAGDMLNGATTEQVIATGFHRNTLVNEEGGTDPEQFRVESVVDRVSTTGAVFLGLTIGCARCHDHKYDPISQREFYEFFSLLNNADEPTLPVPTTQQAKEEPALLAEIAQVEKRLRDVDMNSAPRQAEWEQKFSGRLDVPWTVLDPIAFVSAGGATITKLDDKSLLVGGAVPESDTYTITSALPAGTVTALKLEVLTHDSLPHRGPGLADNGNLVLNELAIAARPVAANPPTAERSAAGGLGEAQVVAIAHAKADVSVGNGLIEYAFDGKPDTYWTIYGGQDGLNVDRTATFVFKDELAASAGTTLAVTLLQRYSAHYQIGCLRLSVTSAPRDVLTLPDKVRQLLAVPAEQRSDQQRKDLAEEYKRFDPERIPLNVVYAELKERQKQLAASITTSLVMKERSEPRETHIHIRGDFLRHGAKVQPAVPHVLPPLTSAAGAAPNRLDLARWLVAADNPLTPRVTVNRLWQQYFGQGIVETENDFGTQGSPPTHPELLDWLAAQLIDGGWRLKSLHRLIVTSATYRQSSAYRRDLVERDATNKLLARMPRLRLDAEVIRDAALAVGGLLTSEVGGPGVYPPQPQGIYRFTQQVKYWNESTGADRYRRGLYTYFWRSSPYPFLMTFDAPDANTTCTRRVRSNTPLQALTMANDRVFIEAAQGVAARMLREAPSTSEAERIRFAFRLCFARKPSADEAIRLSQLLEAERRRTSTASADPASSGISEIASWTALARVLLNLDEFVTRE